VAKTRVHELAKTYGIESKEVLDKLKEMGEFVKSASSTIELPVEMKFKKTYGDALLASQATTETVEAPAEKPAAKKAPAAAPATAESNGATVAEPEAPAAPRPGPKAAVPAEPEAPGAVGFGRKKVAILPVGVVETEIVDQGGPQDAGDSKEALVAPVGIPQPVRG